MQYVCNISLLVLPNWLESVRLNIGCPVARTDGRAVYGHVINKFSGMGRFTYPWCSAIISLVRTFSFKAFHLRMLCILIMTVYFAKNNDFSKAMIFQYL